MSFSATYVVIVKEKHFKTKYRTAGLLHNVNSMTHFKFKLQLQFRMLLLLLLLL